MFEVKYQPKVTSASGGAGDTKNHQKDTQRGDWTHDHTIKSRALYQLS